MDKMSADIVMDNAMDLQNNQPPMDLKMPSLKRDKPRPYSRPSKQDLDAMRKERARVLLSLIPSDKRKKIGLDLSLMPKRSQALNTKKCGPKGPLPTFPYLFWNVVENDTYRSVWWSIDGMAVVIHEKMFSAEFLEKDVIDQVFGMRNIKSFYCQLNQYGFTRPKFDMGNHRNPTMDITAKEVKVFTNPYFQKGCGHLLDQVQRRVVTKVAETSPVTEKKSIGASGHVQRPVKGLRTPCLMLAPEFAVMASHEPSALDQLEALLADNQAQQPALNPEAALLYPSLTLFILLGALLNPDILQMA